MKKLIVLFILFVFSPAVNATIRYQCVPEPYPVGSKLSSFINTLTGTNFISRKTVENIIESNLKENTNSEFRVKLTPFNATDLLAGKFKSFKFEADEAVLGGLHLHNISGETLCEYNRIVFAKDKAPQVYEDFFVGFSGKMTNEDLQKTLQDEQFEKYVSNMHLKIGGLSLIKIHNPKLFISDNKLKYNFNLSAFAFFKEISKNISCDVGLKVDKGKIALSMININNHSGLPDELFTKMINRINPFRVNLEKSLGIPSYLDIDNVKIEKDEILFSGTFVAPKNVGLEE